MKSTLDSINREGRKKRSNRKTSEEEYTQLLSCRVVRLQDPGLLHSHILVNPDSHDRGLGCYLKRDAGGSAFEIPPYNP
jgi:hypothetical protein